MFYMAMAIIGKRLRLLYAQFLDKPCFSSYNGEEGGVIPSRDYLLSALLPSAHSVSSFLGGVAPTAPPLPFATNSR